MVNRLIIFITLFFCGGVCSAQSPDEYYLQGVAALNDGNYNLAVENLDYAVDHIQENTRSLMKRGEALLLLNETAKAISDFEQANILHSHVADLWLAKCHARLGNTEQAIELLTSHLQSEYRLPESQIKRDPVFDQLQMTDEWFELWQQEWYTATEILLQDVSYYRDRNRMQEAMSVIESAVNEGITDAALFVAQGTLNLDQKLYAPAISSFNSAIQMDKTNPEYFAYRGRAFFGASRYKEAIDDFSNALRIEPELFDLYLARADAYAALNDFSRAVADVRTYMRYFQSDAEGMYKCGEYLFENGNYMEALRYFNRNLQQDDTKAKYFKARGKTYVMTHTYQYAIYDLSMALDLDPDDGETYLYLGRAKLETGNKIAACSDFQTAQRLGETEALRYIIENCGN